MNNLTLYRCPHCSFRQPWASLVQVHIFRDHPGQAIPWPETLLSNTKGGATHA